MAMAVVRGSSSGGGVDSSDSEGQGDVIVMFGGGVYPTTYFNDTWTLEIAALPTVSCHLRLPSSR